MLSLGPAEMYAVLATSLQGMLLYFLLQLGCSRHLIRYLTVSMGVDTEVKPSLLLSTLDAGPSGLFTDRSVQDSRYGGASAGHP